jgi:hypothetical protein
MFAVSLEKTLDKTLIGGGCQSLESERSFVRVDIDSLDSRAYRKFLRAAESARAIEGYVSVRGRDQVKLPRAWLAKATDLTITSTSNTLSQIGSKTHQPQPTKDYE